MKKSILAAGFVLATLALNAQIKVYTGGSNVVIGATPAATPTSFKLQVVGNTVFTQTSSSIVSAAFIRGLNGVSAATNPDYTWFYDDQTGFFHPNSGIIGFSSGGAEKMRVHSNGYLGLGNTSPSSMLSVNGSGNSAWLEVLPLCMQRYHYQLLRLMLIVYTAL